MQAFIYSRFTPNGLIKGQNISSSTKIALQEAEKLGVTWETIPNTKIIKLQLADKIHFFHHQIPTNTKAISLFACSKTNTKSFLQLNNISTAKGFTIYKNDPQEYWQEIFDCLTKPLVIKPTHGSHGDGVIIGINKFERYQKIISKMLEKIIDEQTGVLVEEMFQNAKEFRILTTKKQVIGITHRMPANVIGDGLATIEELIKEKNNDPRRGDKWSDGTTLLKIKINKTLLKYLEKQHKSLTYIPQKNEQIFLRKVSNLSQGGDSFDFTDQAHPSVKEIALKAINALPELNFAGIDFMTRDITKEQNPEDYIIAEINDSPGFDMHDYPYEGINRHAARAFINLIFPELVNVNYV